MAGLGAPVECLSPINQYLCMIERADNKWAPDGLELINNSSTTGFLNIRVGTKNNFAKNIIKCRFLQQQKSKLLELPIFLKIKSFAIIFAKLT